MMHAYREVGPAARGDNRWHVRDDQLGFVGVFTAPSKVAAVEQARDYLEGPEYMAQEIASEKQQWGRQKHRPKIGEYKFVPVEPGSSVMRKLVRDPTRWPYWKPA